MLINRFGSLLILQLALSFELAGKEELERSVVSFSLGRFKCNEATCPPLSLAVQSREGCRLFDLNACGMHFHFQCEADLAKHCAYVVFHGLGTNVEHVKIMILFS